MEKPVRIQRKRVKGWVSPPNTVYVGRPTKYGNPYIISKVFGNAWGVFEKGNNVAIHVSGKKSGAAEVAVWKYMDMLEQTGMDISELRGKNLMCWCKEGEPCHADVLLELANR